MGAVLAEPVPAGAPPFAANPLAGTAARRAMASLAEAGIAAGIAAGDGPDAALASLTGPGRRDRPAVGLGGRRAGRRPGLRAGLSGGMTVRRRRGRGEGRG
ncbi:hypothetical protein SR39_07980, partial [Methylobacterium radiotolerans]